ncbi:citrate synthase family protein [Paraburkholderia sp. HD33-4]|uniref:citrate synthase family protein n=1 Tax=Paraburkholderia sp. HD33-4 TaxID=2883242 RepID=UPI001F48A6DC|nr:citrate synthase family protein [Paraburkholderia sp. HD33-4]
MKNWMTQEEACDALGVRKQTLYAYVSRGRIEVQGDPDNANRNLYRSTDIAALVKRRSLGRARKNIAASTMSWGEPIIDTSISTIVRGRLYYRGRDAVQLAASSTLEEAARLLWNTTGPPHFPSFEPVPFEGPISARIYAALACDAAYDRAQAARDLAQRVDQAAALVGRLASNFVELRADDGPLHLRIANAWGAEHHADLLRRVLVLLADQELTSSSFAARVAASTGASLGACMVAGLAAFSGPLHGNAIVRVLQFMDDAKRSGTETVVRTLIAAGEPLPGFGHELYPQGDPRAADLLASFQAPDAARDLIDRVERLTGKLPAIDIALAALVEHCALPEGAAFALFSIARSVGWMAHSIEQITQGCLLRPRAHYVGPAALD